MQNYTVSTKCLLAMRESKNAICTSIETSNTVIKPIQFQNLKNISKFKRLEATQKRKYCLRNVYFEKLIRIIFIAEIIIL